MEAGDRRAAEAARGLEGEPAGDLVKRLAEQTSKLVRQELGLAQAELRQKGKRAGIGGGLLGAAGVLGLYALGALVAALILLLATALEPWLAALIVAAAIGLVAGVLALVGKKQVQAATPPVPEQARETVQADVQHVKERAGKA